MTLRYIGAICASCKGRRPHTAKGECTVCRLRDRKAARKVKAAAIGSPLQARDLVQIADELWSVWIRAAHHCCEMCGTRMSPEYLECAHGYSRGTMALRFDSDNTFALCPIDHHQHTPPRGPWFAWIRSHLGDERADRLKQLSRVQSVKLRASDLLAVISDAHGKILALPPSDRREWAVARMRTIDQRLARLRVEAA